tara:strand:- start:264 stop:854 length:591 start_codon:yes stop_codon:yes gene_type:complete
MATIESLQAQIIALQASEAKLTAENEKLKEEVHLVRLTAHQMKFFLEKLKEELEEEKLKADADDGDLVYSEEDLSELKEGWGEVLQDEIDVLKADQVLLEGWLEDAREQLGVLEEREDSELEKIGALEYDISENQREHKKENKKITDHRDRILKKMRRQTKENEALKKKLALQKYNRDDDKVMIKAYEEEVEKLKD